MSVRVYAPGIISWAQHIFLIGRVACATGGTGPVVFQLASKTMPGCKEAFNFGQADAPATW